MARDAEDDLGSRPMPPRIPSGTTIWGRISAPAGGAVRMDAGGLHPAKLHGE